jgi:hypothetical protein
MLELSDVPDKVLLVSERTLYLLANYAMDEVRQYSAYAESYGDADLYYAVEFEDTIADFVDEIANRFGIEVIPVDMRPIYSLTGALTAASAPIPHDTPTIFPISSFDELPVELVTYASNVFTVVRTGRMMISARASWAGSSAGGFRQILININGTTVGYALEVPAHASSVPMEVNIRPYIFAGNTIEFKVRQTSGVPLNVLGGTAPNYYTSVSMVGY